MIQEIMNIGWPIYLVIGGIIALILSLFIDDLLSAVLPDGLFPTLSIGVLAFGSTVVTMQSSAEASSTEKTMYIVATIIAAVAASATIFLIRWMKKNVDTKETVIDIQELVGKQASVVWWSSHPEDPELGKGEVLISDSSIGKIVATGSKDLKTSDVVVIESVESMYLAHVRLV